jgi:hypothetical protein
MKRDDRPENLADALAREIETRLHHPALAVSGLKPVLAMLATYLRVQDTRVADLERRAGVRQ